MSASGHSPTFSVLLLYLLLLHKYDPNRYILVFLQQVCEVSVLLYFTLNIHIVVVFDYNASSPLSLSGACWIHVTHANFGETGRIKMGSLAGQV